MPKAWGRLGYGREVISCYGRVQALSSLFSLQVSVDLANKSADEVYLAIAGLEADLIGDPVYHEHALGEGQALHVELVRTDVEDQVIQD